MDPNGATLPRLERPEPGRPPGAWRPRIVLATGAVLSVAVLARKVRRVVVTGASMAPELLDGDRLVVLAPLWGRSRVTPGDVIAVPDPRARGRLLVKRVASVDPLLDVVEVLGDAPEASTDSRTFGPVPRGSVVGRAAYRYGPPGRSGHLARSKEYHRA
jgi:nickel-type superoxide dismutase maturation protease